MAIQEVSEPVTPDHTEPSTPRSSYISNISKLLRSQQNSPEDVKSDHWRSSADEDKNDEHTLINGVSVPELVISQTDGADEQTPLIRKNKQPDTDRRPDDNGPGDLETGNVRSRKPKKIFQLASEFKQRAGNVVETATHPKTWSGKAIWEKGVKEPVSLLPCVFLGVLLNVLDALSYGNYAGRMIVRRRG